MGKKGVVGWEEKLQRAIAEAMWHDEGIAAIAKAIAAQESGNGEPSPNCVILIVRREFPLSEEVEPWRRCEGEVTSRLAIKGVDGVRTFNMGTMDTDASAEKTAQGTLSFSRLGSSRDEASRVVEDVRMDHPRPVSLLVNGVLSALDIYYDSANQ